MLDMAGDELELAVTCSKGTYIRVLAEDIGRALGCGACLAALRRTAVGGFALDAARSRSPRLAAMTPAERDAALLPPDALVAALPRFDLDAEQAHGGSPRGRPSSGRARRAPGSCASMVPGGAFWGSRR